MLGNKLSACHTHTHTHSNTVSNEAVKPAALFHLPLHLNPAVFPPARPGGLWEGDGFLAESFFRADPQRSAERRVSLLCSASAA